MDRKRNGGPDLEDLELLEPESWADSQEPLGTSRRRGIRRKVGTLRDGAAHWLQIRWKTALLVCMGILSLGSAAISIWSVALLERLEVSQIFNSVPPKLVSKIAFGSCTAYDYQPQPVWTNGVIPSEPDAWIWLGDMAYMDEPRVNCDSLSGHKECDCTNDWLHQAPYSCMAGDMDHALSRVQAQLANPDYAQFLAFMCPGHRSKGLHPPTGPDPSVCPRRIFGTYDDHDFSWNNGNKRLPHKDSIKNIFLDAVGEPASSARRNSGRGIEWKYTLNEGKRGREIDIFLLDERYNRDPLPCHMRRDYCEKLVLTNVASPKYAWCLDFLHAGDLGTGSCCDKDDKIFYGWCMQENNKGSPMWAEACDPTSTDFGTRPLAVDPDGQLREATGAELVDGRVESPFCEVLGREQRLWLEGALEESNAAIKLIVSSSVLIGNPDKKVCGDLDEEGKTGVECRCSSDDWECYKPAQLQLLHLLTRTSGCVAVLTGDFHYSDIKVLRPGEHAYSPYYKGIDASYPLYQVMASGLTTSTGRNWTCDVRRRDSVKLRDHEECEFVRGPSFGMVQVHWEERDPIISLQVRDGSGQVKLESNLTLSTCSSEGM